MRRSGKATVLERVRREVLLALRRGGPVPVPGLPRRWPTTRLHLRYAVRALLEEALVREVPSEVPGRPALELTGKGVEVADEVPSGRREAADAAPAGRSKAAADAA